MAETHEIQIELLGAAEKTDKPADEDVILEIDTEPMDGLTDDEISSKGCPTGIIRSKKVKKICYCQLCCKGSWYYVFKKVNGRRVYLKCKQGSLTVECSGHNYIVRCH